jgi:hypothetical protein
MSLSTFEDGKLSALPVVSILLIVSHAEKQCLSSTRACSGSSWQVDRPESFDVLRPTRQMVGAKNSYARRE